MAQTRQHGRGNARAAHESVGYNVRRERARSKATVEAGHMAATVAPWHGDAARKHGQQARAAGLAQRRAGG